MIDLKPYYDEVIRTEAEIQHVAHEIDVLFREGTGESQAAALAKKTELDAAQAKYSSAVALYESMQNTNRPNDIAKNFIPVSTVAAEANAGSQPTVIKRAEYDRLSLIDRDRLIKSGGKLED